MRRLFHLRAHIPHVSVSRTHASKAPLALPWATTLPPPTDPQWEGLGRAVIHHAISLDTGAAAFEECQESRRQLQSIVQSLGHDMTINIFGGLAILKMLEVGGDVDFVGVSNVEPSFHEASEVVSRLSRELRRLGLKSTAVPRARVPLLKVDRVSRTTPGSLLHSLSTSGVFQLTRSLDSLEQDAFAARLQTEYGATQVEWAASKQVSTVKFPTTADLILAITNVQREGNVAIPLRLPVDPRNGPEIYRHTFDLVLSSTGLRNSFIFAQSVEKYTYARHLLLAVKRWGRSSGIVNSIDGLLASYALTVMMVHFLCKLGIVPKVNNQDVFSEPQMIPRDLEYVPLAPVSGNHETNAEVGYLLAAFFEYYSGVFDYNNSVVCTTNLNLEKKRMKWDVKNETARPPFFEICIKDPCGLDNIGRNLNAHSARYVKEAHAMALQAILKDFSDAEFVMKILATSAPTPVREFSESYPSTMSEAHQEQAAAKHLIQKMEFHKRREKNERFGQGIVDARANEQAAQNLSQSVVNWIHRGGEQT